MNRQVDGFEPGDRVCIRKAATSGRTEQTVWEVTGLADDGRTVELERTSYGKTHTARARAPMLWLVQTIEERMAEELMRKPELPKPGRPKPGRPDAFVSGSALLEFKTALAGKTLRIRDLDPGFVAQVRLMKSRPDSF